MNILSIDAWRYGDGWTWNAWHRVGSIDKATLDALGSNRKVLAYMREHGYLSAESAGRVAVEDDGYNVVLLEKGNRRPLFAIEYGPECYGN